MLKIFNKFFNFCGVENKYKFYKSIIYGVIMAFCETLKILAIYLVLDAIIHKSLTITVILQGFAIIFASIVLGIVIRYRATMLQCEGGYGTTADKRIEIAEHLRYLPMGYFNRNSLGYITSVTTNTMENLGDVATRVIMLTTQGILTTILIEVMILISDYRIGIIVGLGIIAFFFINRLMQRKAQDVSKAKVNSDSNVVEKVVEYIQGISEVKAYNLTGGTSKRLNKVISENVDCNIKCEKSFIPYMAVQNIVTKLTGVIMTTASIIFFINDTLSVSMCIVMIICSFMIYSSLEQAGSYSALLRVVDLSVDKAQEILDLEPMDISGEEITPENYNIEISDIDFSYNSKKIIDHLSLTIPERTTTAIVGPSGGGKTTLCNLIARFWDVDKGTIKLGGYNVEEYSMDSLMKNFSFVFQNVYLFHDTIANNIKFGQKDASDKAVIEAAKKACCHDFIMGLPDGYETVIGEGGASLSGGEKQRISIARAIMKDAPIIILDEATANVDPENESDLIHAIEALTKEKTIIMIAHRLKTVRNADQIIVLDKGRIVQKGNHNELIKQEGIYKRFVNSRELATSWKL